MGKLLGMHEINVLGATVRKISYSSDGSDAVQLLNDLGKDLPAHFLLYVPKTAYVLQGGSEDIVASDDHTLVVGGSSIRITVESSRQNWLALTATSGGPYTARATLTSKIQEDGGEEEE